MGIVCRYDWATHPTRTFTRNALTRPVDHEEAVVAKSFTDGRRPNPPPAPAPAVAPGPPPPPPAAVAAAVGATEVKVFRRSSVRYCGRHRHGNCRPKNAGMSKFGSSKLAMVSAVTLRVLRRARRSLHAYAA